MRNLITLVAAAALAACQAPEPAAGTGGKADRIISIPDSSSGAPSVGAPAPAPEAGLGNATAASGQDPAMAEAIPAIFHGRYDESRAACDRPSDYRLVVTPSELRFHESIGKVRRVSIEGPRIVHVVADYQGEGESWSNSRELRLSHDDATIMISGDGTGLTRVRCP